MTQTSAGATEVARRLWTLASQGDPTTQDPAAAVTRLCTGLRTGLVRWIGTDGYQALLLRALAQAGAQHTWLAELGCVDGALNGVRSVTAGRRPADVAEGMVGLVANLVHVLGRITGEEMALRLVEHAWTAGASAKARSGRRDND